jgi:hypothetical protein
MLTRSTRVSDRFNEPNSKCGSALAKFQLAITLPSRVCAPTEIEVAIRSEQKLGLIWRPFHEDASAQRLVISELDQIVIEL